MICKVTRAEIFQYLDGELSRDERADVERHLASCPDCSRLVTIERAFRAAYMERLRPDPVPESVRERAVRLLETLASPPSSPADHRRVRRLGLLAVALALVLVGGVLGAVVRDTWRAARVSIIQLADASVDQHQKLARGLLPYDIAAASPRQAEQWFRNKLDFNVSIPELTNEHLAFLGGRISHLRGVDVAALGYRVDGKSVSLFVIPEEQYRRLGLSETPKFKVLTRRGYDVIVWRSHGTGYALVSEVGGQPCLVCHAPEEKLNLPPAPSAHRS